MDLSPYIESVRTGVTNASALADEHTQHVAERLGTAIDSSTRLALIQALSDAAATISAELAPSSVEVRMSGGEPEFAVSVHGTDQEPTLLLPDAEPESAAVGDDSDAETDDEPVARVTLRLPQSVKAKVDDRATAEGISTNAWLIRVVMDALVDDSGRPGWWPRRPGPPDAPGAFFGPNGPFGQHGVFGPHGPFGQASRSEPVDRPHQGERRSRGNVQGWVR